MADRNSFSTADQARIGRIERTGASLEKNKHGWGFFGASDKALKLIKDVADIAFLDLFEACDAGDVSDEGIAHIKGMTGLRYLALGPGISDKGLDYLAGLVELRELRLDNARDVTDDGLKHLKKLTKLENLTLQYTEVAGTGFTHLVGLKKLKELNLEGAPVTKDAVATLQKALPKCKIRWNRTKAKKAVEPAQSAAPPSPVGFQLNPRATLRGHANKPGDAAFSPDGGLLATVAFNKVLLWDPNAGAKLRPIELKRGSLWGAAFTPDGKLLASGSNGGCVLVWDTASGKVKASLETPNPVFTAVDIDAGGKYLAAGGQDGNIYLWDLFNGKLLRTIPATKGDFLSAVVFSPDGKTLASCGRDPFVRLWTIPEGVLAMELPGPPYQNEYAIVRDAAFSPDGTMLASAHPDRTMRLWRLPQGKEIAAIVCPKPVFALAYHPGGNILATASDGDTLVRLWNAGTQECVTQFETGADFDCVNIMTFSPDGKTLVTNGKGGSALLLDVQGPV